MTWISLAGLGKLTIVEKKPWDQQQQKANFGNNGFEMLVLLKEE